MIASRKPRGAKVWALFTVGMLLGLFGFAAFSGWWGINPNLGFVALVVMLLLLRAAVVLDRRAAGAGGERPGDSAAVIRSKRRLRTVGIVLVVVGIVLVAVGVEFFNNSSAMLGLGLAAAGIGVVYVLNSFGRLLAVPKTIGRFERFMRIVGIALVPLMAFSTWALFHSAATGYHEAWPLHTFGAVGLVSLLVWPYLLGMAYARWLRR